MAAAKGTRPPAAGKGRKAGSQNRVPKELKEMILGALVDAGGQEYLLRQAKKKNPGPFLALVGKILPKDLNVQANISLAEIVRQARKEADERDGQ